MRHLFNSVVQVEAMTYTVRDGEAYMDWAIVPGGEWVECRLDLNFLRPGKDAPAPINAGVAPDRIGIMFCGAEAPLKAGVRVVTIPNAYGREPVKGVFEIKSVPDMAIDYSDAHHIEVQIVEGVQEIENTFGEEASP